MDAGATRLPAEELLTYDVVVYPGITNTTTVSNCAFLNDIQGHKYCLEKDVTISNQLELRATKTIANLTRDDGSYRAGDEVKYTITLENISKSTIQDFTITDSVDSNLDYTNSSIAGGSSQDDSFAPLLRWRLGELKADATSSLSFQAMIPLDTPDGTFLENEAFITYAPDGSVTAVAPVVEVMSDTQQIATPTASTTPDTRFSATPTATGTVVTSTPVASTTPGTPVAEVNDVTIEKSVERSMYISGDHINYQIVLRNRGTVPAKNIRIVDEIPYFTSYLPGSVTLDGVLVSYEAYEKNTNSLYVDIPLLNPDRTAVIAFKVIAGNPQGAATFVDNKAQMFLDGATILSNVVRVMVVGRAAASLPKLLPTTGAGIASTLAVPFLVGGVATLLMRRKRKQTKKTKHQ